MTFGTREFKNGKQVGCLHFDTGKKVYLNVKELFELRRKINDWVYQVTETQNANKKRPQSQRLVHSHAQDKAR